MCDNGIGNRPPRSAETKLAALLRDETGAIIDEKLLRLFIRANWKKITLYAHAIHGTPEEETPTHAPFKDHYSDYFKALAKLEAAR